MVHDHSQSMLTVYSYRGCSKSIAFRVVSVDERWQACIANVAIEMLTHRMRTRITISLATSCLLSQLYILHELMKLCDCMAGYIV